MSSMEDIPGKGVMQNIKYSGSYSEYATELQGEVVNIVCNEGNHNHGSSKVKLTDKIDYNWEFKYYRGHLVAAHINGKVFAYGMKGKDGGMIRVTEQEDASKRMLIKNFKEDIKDLAFAYSRDEIILGCIDCEGNILVYEIKDKEDTLSHNLLLHIYHQYEPVRSKTNFRLIWCPYLPNFEEDDEDSDSDDPEKMFVVLNGTRAEIYNLSLLQNKYVKGTPMDPDESYEGYIEIELESELVDAAFSSDGTAIAIACLNGYVSFYQLYMFEEKKQKCLHEWQPHGGRPLTSIIFIDNVLEFNSECWKFTITGANNNTEIKLWSCETWTCLQTINFLPSPKKIISDLYFNISIDYTGQYLLVSDVNNRAIYVMQLKRNDQEQLVCVTLLSQFLVPATFLSFHILEAALKKMPYSYNNSTEDLYDNDEIYDEDSEITVTSVKLLVIQPKKFQECNIIFQPEAMMYNDVSVTENIVDPPLVDLTNGDSKENIEERKDKVPELEDLQNSVTLLIQQQEQEQINQQPTKLTLMTPDDFNASSEKNSRSHSRSSSVRNSLPNNETPASESLEKLGEKLVSEFQRPQKENFASGDSSPSREVEEILSLNNSTTNFGTQEYFNNLANLQIKEEPSKEQEQDGQVTWPKIPVVPPEKIPQIKSEPAASSSDLTKQDMETVYFRINALESTIREQNIILQQLHQDMKAVSQAVSRNHLQKDIREEIAKELECAMSKQHLQIAKTFENLVHLQKNRDRELHDNLVTAVSQILSKSISDKLQLVVQHEMKHSVLPTVRSLVEQFTRQMDAQYAQKFANIDMVIKECFAKIINNKSLTESMEKCYRDIITSALPSWEKVCNQMFQQINDTFTRGTKEYTQSVESYMERQRKVQEKGKDLIMQMQTVSDTMKSSTERLTDTLNHEIQNQFGLVVKNLQEKLSQNIKDTVSAEITKGFKSHASILEDSVLNAVRSRAVTPAPHTDPNECECIQNSVIRERIQKVTTVSRIQASLSQQNYNDAFQTALSAENLGFVIYVCERVDINKVLDKEGVLSQSVLLALIQQLSMELQKNTDIKLSFIRAAFLNLNYDFPQTKQFIPKVLKELSKQLTGFMQSNAPLGKMTEARLLKMAVESVYSK